MMKEGLGKIYLISLKTKIIKRLIMKKIKEVAISAVPPTSTDVGWFYRGALKYFSNGKWMDVFGGNIVDSVNKLNPNAPNGSLATVSNIKTEEIEVEYKFSIRDIYVEENPDCEPLMELKLKAPETWPTSDLHIFFGQKGYNSFDEVLEGNSLVLVLTSTGVNIEIYINGEDGGYGSILSDSVNEELLNEVNSTISSWGGIVFYGTVAFVNEPSFIALTKSQIDYVDSIIGYDNGTHIEIIETHTNDIYFKETTGWRKINDIKIVDSVDKLDKNAPQGSLASVAINTGGEVLFSELYQPTSDEVNMETGVVDTTNLSSISEISVNSSFDTSVEPQNFTIYLFSKDFDMQGGVGQLMGLMPGGAMIADASTQGPPNQIELFIPNEDGTITVNEENLAIINNLLSSTEFVYGGIFSTSGPSQVDPSYADIFYKAIGGIQKTDLYIKDVKGWKVFGDEELKNQISDLEANLTNLENTINNLEDKTDLIVNSVNELPQDAPLGSQANVILYNRTSFVPVSRLNFGDRIFEIQGIFPEELPNMPVFTTGEPFALNFVYGSQYVERITMVLIRENTDYVFKGGIPYSNSLELARYNSSKQLISTTPDNINQLNALISTHTYKLDQTSSPNGVNVNFDWGTVLLTKAQSGATTIYVKNETGWEQYSELVDQSVTTEKVANEAIVFDKLSVDIQKVLSFAIQHFGLIIFKDKKIGTICITNWDANGDGVLTKEEASAVTDISTVFHANEEIVSFNELSNFTNLTSIPKFAFYNCSKLNSITLPEGLTSIEDDAFKECSRLTSITIPEGVTSIGESAFSGCSSLTSINIPESVTIIKRLTFGYCTGLTSLTLPESLTYIVNWAFYNCTGLTSIRSYATTPPGLGEDVFYGAPATMSIYVPDTSVDAYKAASRWSSYASQIKPMSEYVES